MPLKIKKINSGYKVVDSTSNHIFSKNKPLTKKNALKQRIALAISTSKKSGKPISNYFI